MRVDFYQLSRDPAEAVVALLAGKTLEAGERLLVVADDSARLGKISEALWSARPEESFLANGRAGTADDARQPILLSDRVEPANGAQFLLLADGLWREEAAAPGAFERVFLVFDAGTLEGARACWRKLGTHDGLERNFWKQEDGRWIRAA
ncbi:MAG: DNA polymerase III subunit chi [Sphingomonadales bacterium]|nr:DNA polymerase III subunit chi [Sphingomonadales bacterium]MBU3992399.1 DNA polymerase III subunit chi [Alphaproteobacteria bacterium]